MADVQTENGYTRIANEILEQLAFIKLSPTQYRLLFVVWRYTYGFNRKEHDMSLTFLASATGCDKRQIQRELKGLEAKKIIYQKTPTKKTRAIGFNKNYDEWGNQNSGSIGETTNDNSTNGETTNSAIGETVNRSIGETTNQERNKENIKDNVVVEVVDKKPTRNVYQIFESEFGRPLGSFEIQQLTDWLNDSKLTDELILEALKRAVFQGKFRFSYIQSILTDWIKNNVRTIREVNEHEKQFQEKQKQIAKNKNIRAGPKSKLDSKLRLLE